MTITKFELKKGRRPRVGIMVGNYHSDHPIRIVRTIYELLSAKGIDTRFYLGTESSSFLTGQTIQGNEFDYQYSSLYAFSRFDDLDAMVVSIGTMTIFQKGLDPREFIKELPDIPLVLLENDMEVTNGCYLISDNYTPFRELVEHMITEHGLTKIGFISGPVANRDSQIRQKGYMDAMAAHDLTVTKDMIAIGDFSEHVEGAVRQLLDSNPGLQGIACANNEMAISVYNVCKERGLKVGKDLAVVGYDDIELARYMDPPLSTCSQDYSATVVKAAEQVMAILAGKTPQSEVVPTKVVLRESCGCAYVKENHEDHVETGEDHMMQQMITNLWKSHAMEHQPWIGSLFLREMMSQVTDSEKFYEVIGRTLNHLECQDSFISLLPEPKVVENYQLECPEEVFLVMRQHGDRIEYFQRGERPCLQRDKFEDMFHNVDGAYMHFLLFYEKYQYGVFVVKITPEQIPFYYTLSLEIGSALRYLYLTRQRNEAQKSLRVQNNLLDFLASHDELTGLYNRAGVIKQITEALEDGAGRDTGLCVFMADMDHLKQINDTFGHPEGDIAIRKAADMLRSQLGATMLGRIGGDEYMGCFPVSSESEMEDKFATAKVACNLYNLNSGKEYTLNISFGYVYIRPHFSPDFFSVYHDVDKYLYEAKKHRSDTCLRIGAV